MSKEPLRNVGISLPLAVSLVLIGAIVGYIIAIVQFDSRDTDDHPAVPGLFAPTGPSPTPTLPPLGSAQAYYERGLEWWGKRLPVQAIGDFSRAIDLDPTLSEAYFFRGWAYQAGYYENGAPQTFPDLALADYDRALALNPDHSRALNNRGLIYWERGQREKARDDFRRALELDPDYLYPVWHLALLYDYMQDYAEAIRYYTRAEELGLNVHYWRARAAMRNEQYDLAVEDYTALIDASGLQALPLSATYSYYRGLAHTRLKQYEAAIQDFTVAIHEFEKTNSKPNPPLTQVYLDRAQANTTAGHTTAAVMDLSHLITLNPVDPEPYRLRGDLHYALGNTVQALADYREYTRLSAVVDPDLLDRIEAIEAALEADAAGEK